VKSLHQALFAREQELGAVRAELWSVQAAASDTARSWAAEAARLQSARAVALEEARRYRLELSRAGEEAAELRDHCDALRRECAAERRRSGEAEAEAEHLTRALEELQAQHAELLRTYRSAVAARRVELPPPPPPAPPPAPPPRWPQAEPEQQFVYSDGPAAPAGFEQPLATSARSRLSAVGRAAPYRPHDELPTGWSGGAADGTRPPVLICRYNCTAVTDRIDARGALRHRAPHDRAQPPTLAQFRPSLAGAFAFIRRQRLRSPGGSS
jgi:hypothetical protein